MESAKEALDEIMRKLKQGGFDNLIFDIETTIARGKVEEVESQNRAKELAQVALTANEALKVVTDMIVSYLEPVTMIQPIVKELLGEQEPLIEWKKDYVESSPIEFSKAESSDLESLQSYSDSTEEIISVIKQLREVADGKL
ncbi:TPA: hypothetical protein NG573_004599 [Vibrio parahaemolyticus]|uniref:hypothetical protein n=1 Tax=Vibrio parahaemolyticus TaxID=670 RepID=UPI001E36016D|nr:hypothetical protein [Vibrio parahaemolyticus]HCE3221177.1 hypothetical protein [Vibrio parahaemolyticus]HCG8217532.1 hypothetical protein [Vibrio parahaemolyticus]HCM0852212.1 hypothetical protein [Vibrio parahaemolyticus]HCM1502837.1 hypothetical protein [Vibrio parahaemolyticus]